MDNFYHMRSSPPEGTAYLRLDYELDDVDTLAINNIGGPPKGYLDRFDGTIVTGKIGAMLPNSVGWNIVAPQLASLCKQARNSADITAVELPARMFGKYSAFRDYAVLGIS